MKARYAVKVEKNFLESLKDIPHSRDPSALRVKSADFSWFSPIMSAALAGRTAEVVLSPRNEEEVVRIASACARHRVPLVARGGGTGNFGQAVPLAGGAVVEMLGLDRMVFQKRSVARAQAGIRLGVLIAVLFAQSKWIEMSFFPYAVILQVTPVVAIAPLIIIWVKDTATALLICAWIVAFFPIVSNTTLGLNSTDHNLLNLLQL